MKSHKSIDRRKIVFIVIAWTIAGAIQTIYDHFLIGSHLASDYAENYIFLKSFISNSIAGLIAGLIGSYLLVHVVNKKFRSAPYYRGVLVVGLAIIVGIFLIPFLIAIFQVIFLYGGFESETGKEAFNNLIYTTEHIKNMIYWGGVVAGTQMGLHINDKFGQGVLWNMITGKYHRATTENRIFMFLDMKDSTPIAERLGNEKYHQFLKDVFSDITNPIIRNFGQIYQYVGDEVVISWPLDQGLIDNRCINCFFDVQAALNDLKLKYLDIYGVEPIFKAGIHHGRVVAGEIGVIKRDITYSGDTLNTTARMQAMCNNHKTKLLVSKSLAAKLKLTGYNLRSIGSIELKGKQQSVELIAVALSENIDAPINLT